MLSQDIGGTSGLSGVRVCQNAMRASVDTDGATVFAGWGDGAGAVDDVTDVLRSRGSGAAGSAVADVFGARLRPGCSRRSSPVSARNGKYTSVGATRLCKPVNLGG